MKTVGWGIVGCSDIVERRAGAAIKEQRASRLVAFHSRDLSRARAFTARFEAKRAYDDVGALLHDDAIDAVYIATEVDRHADLAIAAADAGKHVLVEKPMALDAGQCASMIAAAERNHVYLSVAYYARFFPKAEQMRRAIAEGQLGRVVRANVRVIGRYAPAATDPKFWRVTGRGGGNQLADVGSHRIDLLTFFLGPPVQVSGFVDRLSMDYPAADTETALIRFSGGAHATVMANANVPHPARIAGGSSLEIYGTEGTLLTDPWSVEPPHILGREGAPQDAAAFPPPRNAHAPLIDDFADAIATNRSPRFTGVDGMWATAVIAGAYESARNGAVVPIRTWEGFEASA